MDNVEAVKYRMKQKRSLAHFKPKTNNKYINFLITRLLISVIIFFGLIISMNLNDAISKFIKEDVLKNNISFTKVSNLYNKYFGNVVPIKNIGKETTTVFKEDINSEDLKSFHDGYLLDVNSNYLVPILNSGIVVFIGEKENYGNTVIVQGNDEVEYWYGNVKDLSVSLYDYVSKGKVLGSTNDEKLYLAFQKNGEFLTYDEVMEQN